MPTLNELLSTTADTDDIVFDNFQFIIDENLRTISVPALGVVFGVEGDKDVNYINFSMVRFYDGTDLSEMELHVNYINAAGDMNYYRVPNIVVQNDTIMFSWLLSHDVTKYRGTTSFTLHFFKQVNGVISKSYNTTPAHGTVLEGINAETYVTEEEQYDILTHLQAELNNYTSVKKTELAMSGQTQLNAIQQKGAATLASIPEDYTTLNNKIKNMEDHFIVTDPAEVNEVTQIEMDPSAPDQEIFTADEINRIEMTIDIDDHDRFENTFHLMYEKAHSSDELPEIVINDHIPNKQFVLDRVDELNEDLDNVKDATCETSEEVEYIESEYIYAENGYKVDLNSDLSKIASEKRADANRSTAKTSVLGGKIYKITYTKTNSPIYNPGYVFTDANGNVLMQSEDTPAQITVTEEVEAPIGSAYLYANRLSATVCPSVYVKNVNIMYSSKSYTKTEVDEKFEKVDEKFEKVDDMIGFVEKTTNLFDKDNITFSNVIKSAQVMKFVDFSDLFAVVIPIKGGKIITIDNNYGNRFQMCTSVDFPARDVDISEFKNGNLSTKKDTITPNVGDKYLNLYVNNTRDFDASALRVYYGTEWIEEDSSEIDKLDSRVTVLESSIIEPTIFKKLGIDNSIKLVSYKPLGVLSKGYICLSCDDGAEALATVTIPKLKEMKQTYGKNIPMTFALMTSSNVLKDDIKKALVQEMLMNYGCAVAIHGTASYPTYSDDDLIAFLDNQKEQLTTLCGVAPSAIIFPNHDYNEKTATISGSYFGVCGTGGTNTPIRYSYNSAGERSNMYTLYRYSLLGNSSSFENKKNDIKNMIDYCVANHKICLPFFHDVDFSRDGSYWTKEQCMELFEYCVSYAVSVGITFCTFGQIPTLL